MPYSSWLLGLYVSARLITVQFSKIKEHLVTELLRAVFRIAAATAILT
jgi:hypothetical protein